MFRFKEYGIEASELLCVGGGSVNNLWCQIISDASGIPVSVPEENETAAYGAALLAGSTFTETPISAFMKGAFIVVATPLEHHFSAFTGRIF